MCIVINARVIVTFSTSLSCWNFFFLELIPFCYVCTVLRKMRALNVVKNLKVPQMYVVIPQEI